MKIKQEIINEIDRRIKHLNKERKKLCQQIPNQRRIHPANKQIEGRIMELKRFRKFIEQYSDEEIHSGI